MADVERKTFPVPPKRPTVIRPDTNGPALPPRPVAPIPGDRPPPIPGRQTDEAPALPRRASVGAAPTKPGGPKPKQPPPLAKPPERPVSVSGIERQPPPLAKPPQRPVSVSCLERKRPEITIVCARPMSEVGFRSDKPEKPPSVSTNNKPPGKPTSLSTNNKPPGKPTSLSTNNKPRGKPPSLSTNNKPPGKPPSLSTNNKPPGKPTSLSTNKPPGKPPSLSIGNKPPGKPPIPSPRSISPAPDLNVPFSSGSENLLIDFDSDVFPSLSTSDSYVASEPSGVRPPPPKPSPVKAPPPVPKKEPPGLSSQGATEFKFPPPVAKHPGPPGVSTLNNTADMVNKPSRAQPPKVPSNSCDKQLPPGFISTNSSNEIEQRNDNEQNETIKLDFDRNDAHNQTNTPSHVIGSAGDEYAVINKPKRPTIIRPGRPVVKEPTVTEDGDGPKPARKPPEPSPRMPRKEAGALITDTNATNHKTNVANEESGTNSTPEFMKLKLKSTVNQSAEIDIDKAKVHKEGNAPPPMLAPKPKPGVLPKPQVMAKPKSTQDSASSQTEGNDKDKSVKIGTPGEEHTNERLDKEAVVIKPTTVKRPTIIRPSKSQSVEKLNSSETQSIENKTTEGFNQGNINFNQAADDSSLGKRTNVQPPPLPNKRPVSMINIPDTVEHDTNEITASKSMNFASIDGVKDKPKPVPRPVARPRPMSMIVPGNKHADEEKSDFPPKPLHRPADTCNDTKPKVPIGVAVLPQLVNVEGSDISLSPPKPTGRPPPPKVSPKTENKESSDDATKTSPHGPLKPGRPSMRPAPPNKSPKVAENISSDEDLKVSQESPPKPGRPPVPKVSPKSEMKDTDSSEEEFHSVAQEPPRPPPPTVRQSPPQRPSATPPRKSSMKEEVESAHMRPPRPDPRPARPLSTPGKVTTSPGSKPARPSSMAVKKTGVPELPSRPGPGHPLYHHMMKAAHGVALHDFTGSLQDELSFKAGEVIILKKSVDSDWLVGQVGEKEGMFPRSFIKVKIPLPGETPDEDSDSDSDIEQPFFDASSDKPDLIGHGPRCRARFDFEGEGPEDLVFEDGDVIKLLERVGPEWRRGELNGKVGLFPLSFVDIIEDLPVEGASSEESVVVTAMFDYEGEGEELSFQRGDTITVQYKVNDEWLYGECGGRKGQFPVPFVDHVPAHLPPLPSQEIGVGRDPLADAEAMWGNEDHESSHTQESPSPKSTSPKTNQPADNAQPSPTQSDKTPVNPTQSEDVPYCIALYDFPGETPEDLSFVPGDRIELMEHVGTDWLKGSLRGNTGIFPAAFVEIHKDLTESNTDTPKKTTEDEVTYGIAQYDFKGESDNELTFPAGARLKLLELVDGAEDWQWAELNGHRGMFPAAFVQRES